MLNHISAKGPHTQGTAKTRNKNLKSANLLLPDLSMATNASPKFLWSPPEEEVFALSSVAALSCYQTLQTSHISIISTEKFSWEF